MATQAVASLLNAKDAAIRELWDALQALEEEEKHTARDAFVKASGELSGMVQMADAAGIDIRWEPDAQGHLTWTAY